jgi:hypothetical protein
MRASPCARAGGIDKYYRWRVHLASVIFAWWQPAAPLFRSLIILLSLLPGTVGVLDCDGLGHFIRLHGAVLLINDPIMIDGDEGKDRVTLRDAVPNKASRLGLLPAPFPIPPISRVSSYLVEKLMLSPVVRVMSFCLVPTGGLLT